MASHAFPNSEQPPSAGSGGSSRVWTPIVDQHATWIAVNPIQGCPKACTYCFLNERGQTAVRPREVASAEQTADLLTNSFFYGADRPVALYTWTDVMALSASRAHLHRLLEQLAVREIPNPIVLITKCHVPNETIELIRSVRRRGLTVLVYLSYSGLGPGIERGIRHAEVAENFPRLAERDIPVVHYWRPSFPESAEEQTMHRVLAHAARYARCTVAAGLKVEPAAMPRLAQVWPQLANTPAATAAEGVYPRAFWQFIHRTWRHQPGYPVFHTNSCALAYVLGRADSFGVFGTEVCRMRNVCPVAQRSRCLTADSQRPRLTEGEVYNALHRRGLGDVPFNLNGGQVTVESEVETNLAATLTHDLGVPVHGQRHRADKYWSSGTAGAKPVIIE